MKTKINKKSWAACPVCGGLPLLVAAGDGLEMAYCGDGHTELCTPVEPVGTSRLAWNGLVEMVVGLMGAVVSGGGDEVAVVGTRRTVESSVLRVVPQGVIDIDADFCIVFFGVVDAPRTWQMPFELRLEKGLVREHMRMYMEHELELCCGLVIGLRVLEAKQEGVLV